MSIEYCNCKYGGSPSSYHDNCLSCDKLIKTIYVKYDELEKKLEIAVEALKVAGWHCSDDGSHDPDEIYDVIEEALAAIKDIERLAQLSTKPRC